MRIESEFQLEECGVGVKLPWNKMATVTAPTGTATMGYGLNLSVDEDEYLDEDEDFAEDEDEEDDEDSEFDDEEFDDEEEEDDGDEYADDYEDEYADDGNVQDDDF